MGFQGPILGVDPGSVATGFGIIEPNSDVGIRVIDAGVIRTKSLTNFTYKLKYLYDELTSIIKAYNPSICVIEDVFIAKNIRSALKLGHARAALIMAAINSGLTVYEYSALEIKKAVVGYGRADKRQVQQMVSIILNLKKSYPKDASDALAVALCHIQSMKLKNLITLSVSR